MGTKNNKVFGVIGVTSFMSNWNADFSLNPRSMSDGTLFASDKSLKYAIKQYWEDCGHDLLGVRTLKNDKGVFLPMSLDETFVQKTGLKLDKKNQVGITKALLDFTDVANFGFTFAVSGVNIGIRGVTQVGQGVNVYEDSSIEVIDITSPYRNSAAGKEDAAQSTLGKKIVVDEAHYLYPFSVNPRNTDNFKDIVEGFDGYTEEMYDRFKDASLVAASTLTTNSKFGSFNSFAVFVELIDGSNKLLNPVHKYIKSFKNEEGKFVYDLSDLRDFVESIREEVKSAEVFIDPAFIELVGTEGFEIFNINTRKEI